MSQKENLVTANNNWAFTVREEQPPQSKVALTWGNAMQVGCRKKVVSYDSPKSSEIKAISQAYKALVNHFCLFSPYSKDNFMPFQLLCSLETKQNLGTMKLRNSSQSLGPGERRAKMTAEGFEGPQRSRLAHLAPYRIDSNCAISDSCFSPIFNLPLAMESFSLPRQLALQLFFPHH